MREVATPAKTTPRVHTAARRLQRLVAEGLDVTDPRSVVDYLLMHETLPCMPTREEWGDGSQMSIGTLRNCDSMAVEILGLCVRNLLERLEALEGGVPAR
jgi:hypothetical protein